LHFAIDDVLAPVAIHSGAVVSKVIYRDQDIKVTVFRFDGGEELTEHQACHAAVVQVRRGRLRFTVDGEELDAVPVSGCTCRRGRRAGWGRPGRR